jgi:hypothetical protein
LEEQNAIVRLDSGKTSDFSDFAGPRDPATIPYIEKLLALPNYSDFAGFIEHEE